MSLSTDQWKPPTLDRIIYVHPWVSPGNAYLKSLEMKVSSVTSTGAGQYQAHQMPGNYPNIYSDQGNYLTSQQIEPSASNHMESEQNPIATLRHHSTTGRISNTKYNYRYYPPPLVQPETPSAHHGRVSSTGKGFEPSDTTSLSIRTASKISSRFGSQAEDSSRIVSQQVEGKAGSRVVSRVGSRSKRHHRHHEGQKKEQENDSN